MLDLFLHCCIFVSGRQVGLIPGTTPSVAKGTFTKINVLSVGMNYWEQRKLTKNALKQVVL